jgi:beta-lactamase class A
VITDTEALTQTFTFRAEPGLALDIDATADLLAELLTDPTRDVTETLVLHVTEPPRSDFAELERVLEEHLTYWKGVGAIYVHDLETGETLGINENAVFFGASVRKVPIMIYVYSRLGKLDEQQREWMEGMIIDSDNLDANALLAAAAGGVGTEVALEGVNEMSEMMQGLGLEHTYQLIPYESAEWLIQQSLYPQGGPAREGEPPYTAADRYLRTTPREMGELFTMLAECADGKGKLLETYDDTLDEKLCDEMMAWLERPHDEERMVAGIPKGVTVAHKGGWIDDMQSDVGIVNSPNGRYVAAIYIWRPDGYVTNVHAAPSPYLGDFSHTIYTFFNPEPIE